MDLKEAREKFIDAWGAFGSAWGINRSMAQVHALLLISHEPLSTEDVMEQLNISRGNANMNLRALIDWSLVRRVLKTGERREYFEAEKDVWKVATHITRERKKRELEPMVKLLGELKRTDGANAESKAFRQMAARLLATSLFLRRSVQSHRTKFSECGELYRLTPAQFAATVSYADKAGLYYRFLPRYVWSNLFEPKQEHP